MLDYKTEKTAPPAPAPTQTLNPHRPKVFYFFPGCIGYGSDGCHMRAAETLAFLREQGSEITFYSYRNHPVWPWTPERLHEFKTAYPDVEVVLDDLNGMLRTWTSFKNLLLRHFSTTSQPIAGASLPFAAPALRQLRRKSEFSYYFLNYADAVTQINGVSHHHVIIDTHDLLFSSRSEWAGWSPRSRSGIKYMRKELGQLAVARELLVLNPLEYNFLKIMLQRELKVTYLPPRLLPNRKASPAETAFDLLFVGSSNNKNVRFLEKFLATFQTWQSNVTLAIAGRVGDHLNKSLLSNPRVTVLGFVKDLSTIYASTKATICPLEGSGVNMKIIESINYGKPVFATAEARAALSDDARSLTFSLDEETVADFMRGTTMQKQFEAQLSALQNDNANNGEWSDFAARLNQPI